MTLALLAALVAVNLAYLFARDRDAARAREQGDAYRLEAAETHRAHIASLERQAETHRAEVQALCQRIQAPEYAVIEHQQTQAGPDETQPLTDEEIAELQDRELALERIERMQREGMLT